MKKFLILSTLLLLLPLFAEAQTTKIGWHIIEKGAEYAVMSPSSIDRTRLTKTLTMGAGEVVMIFDVRPPLCFAYDPMGRIIVFKDNHKLTPVSTASMDAGIGYLLKDIQFLDGSKLSKGSYVWVIGQNIANSTIKIRTFNKKEVDIPMEKIKLLSASLRNEAMSKEFKTAY